MQRKTHPFVTSCMSCTSRSSAVLLCSPWSSICFIQHPSQIQILRPAFGYKKRTQNLGTHSGTNWCQNEARFLGFVLDTPGQLKIRSRVIKNTFRHSDSPTFRNSATQTLRRSGTQTLRHSDTQTFRHSDIQTRGRTHNRPIARTGIQTLRHSDNQTFRHSDTQTMPGQWC